MESLETLGRCVLGDGLKDALGIAIDSSGRQIALVGCREGAAVEKAEVSVIEPFKTGEESWESMRGDLWLGLSGDVSVDGVAGALRLFTREPFVLIAISASSEKRAFELALRTLESLCLRE
ncbi:MAG: hypothetical protein QXS85_02775 [Acidilobaceae archaeon]